MPAASVDLTTLVELVGSCLLGRIEGALGGRGWGGHTEHLRARVCVLCVFFVCVCLALFIFFPVDFILFIFLARHFETSVRLPCFIVAIVTLFLKSSLGWKIT